MTKYTSLLKGKLQELLTARGLPIDGTKEVLIERLEESDKIAAELEADDEPEPIPAAEEETNLDTVQVEKVQIEEVAKNEEASDVPSETAPATVEVSTEAPVVAEATVVVEPPTPETLKAAAVDLLNMKISRAQKFGEEEQVAQLKANLTRIEKFGVELDSALARELGFAPKNDVNKSKSNGNNRGHHNRKRKHYNGRGHHGYGNGAGRGRIQQGRVYKTR